MRKNKILKIFISAILLISLETSVIAATTGVVNVETVRVREEATTKSDIVKLVSIGDKVTITGEEGDWYKVKVEKVTGYIRKDLLTVDGKTVEVEEENNSDTEETKPSNDTTVKPIETEKPEEVPGETAGQETPSNQETPDEVTQREQTNENINVVNGDKVIGTIKLDAGASVGTKIQLTKDTKIKILPSANSSNIVELQANTEVEILEVINRWCRIEAGENIGWVRIDQ